MKNLRHEQRRYQSPTYWVAAVLHSLHCCMGPEATKVHTGLHGISDCHHWCLSGIQEQLPDGLWPMLSANSCIFTGRSWASTDPNCGIWLVLGKPKPHDPQCGIWLEPVSLLGQLWIFLKKQVTAVWPSPILPSTGQWTRHKLICFQWNENVSAMCPYSNCKFQHMCYTCTHNRAVTNVAHQALYCLKCHCLSTSLAASGISLNLLCKFETSHNYINKLAG